MRCSNKPGLYHLQVEKTPDNLHDMPEYCINSGYCYIQILQNLKHIEKGSIKTVLKSMGCGEGLTPERGCYSQGIQLKKPGF